jgi:hypothetical protein
VCIEKKNAKRARSISCSINPSDFEFDKIQEMQGVHGRSKYLRRTSSEGTTQEVCMRWDYSKSLSSKEITRFSIFDEIPEMDSSGEQRFGTFESGYISQTERYHKLRRKNDHDHWIIGKKINSHWIRRKCSSLITSRTEEREAIGVET